MYTPRLGSHPVGGNLSFECEDGFVLRGSAVRQCRPNGMWDGETAVCDSGGECRAGGRVGLGPPREPLGDRPGVPRVKVTFLDFGQLSAAGPTSPARRGPGPRPLAPSFGSDVRAPHRPAFPKPQSLPGVRPHGAEDGR